MEPVLLKGPAGNPRVQRKPMARIPRRRSEWSQMQRKAKPRQPEDWMKLEGIHHVVVPEELL